MVIPQPQFVAMDGLQVLQVASPVLEDARGIRRHVDCSSYFIQEARLFEDLNSQFHSALSDSVANYTPQCHDLVGSMQWLRLDRQDQHQPL